jgi:hypothetical protein
MKIISLGVLLLLSIGCNNNGNVANVQCTMANQEHTAYTNLKKDYHSAMYDALGTQTSRSDIELVSQNLNSCEFTYRLLLIDKRREVKVKYIFSGNDIKEKVVLSDGTY